MSMSPYRLSTVQLCLVIMLEDILLVMKQKRIEQLPSSIFPSKTTSMNIRGHMEVSLSQQAPILQSL